MTSNSDRISEREEIEDLFDRLGDMLVMSVPLFVIGGAAMMEYGLKDSTKDIDIVCRSHQDKEEILRCAGDLGYEVVWPLDRHARLGLNRIAVKGGHTLDVFPVMISYGFGLSDSMWERARGQKIFGLADIRYASPEDIFIMKLIANRPGDIPDCAALVSVGLDFDVVYDEIESQCQNGENRNAWLAFIEEGIARLLDFGMAIPIADKISLLAYEHNERSPWPLERSREDVT